MKDIESQCRKRKCNRQDQPDRKCRKDETTRGSACACDVPWTTHPLPFRLIAVRDARVIAVEKDAPIKALRQNDVQNSRKGGLRTAGAVSAASFSDAIHAEKELGRRAYGATPIVSSLDLDLYSFFLSLRPVPAVASARTMYHHSVCVKSPRDINNFRSLSGLKFDQLPMRREWHVAVHLTRVTYRVYCASSDVATRWCSDPVRTHGAMALRPFLDLDRVRLFRSSASA